MDKHFEFQEEGAEEDDDEEAMYHCGLCGFKDESLQVVEQHAAKKHQLVRHEIPNKPNYFMILLYCLIFELQYSLCSHTLCIQWNRIINMFSVAYNRNCSLDIGLK